MEFTKYYEKSLKRWLEGVFLKKFDLSKGVEMGGEIWYTRISSGIAKSYQFVINYFLFK